MAASDLAPIDPMSAIARTFAGRWVAVINGVVVASAPQPKLVDLYRSLRDQHITGAVVSLVPNS